MTEKLALLTNKRYKISKPNVANILKVPQFLMIELVSFLITKLHYCVINNIFAVQMAEFE